jgi:ankyrin repeat protein/Flp pilus assembly protein TadD
MLAAFPLSVPGELPIRKPRYLREDLFFTMKISSLPLRRALFISLAVIVCGSATIISAQHGGSGAGGGVIGGAAGAVMKLPPKKVVRTTPSGPKPRPGTRPPAVNNSAQVDDALGLADQERQAERYDAAARAYLLASKLAPSDPRPYLGLGHTYYNQKKYPEAEKAYARAAALSHDDSEPYARLAFTYTEMQRLDEALAMGRRAVAVQPDNYYGYLALGYVHYLRHSYADAEAAYRKSVTLAPQPLIVLHLELVRVLSEQRRYSDAAAEAKKAIDIDAKNFSARFNYAVMLQKLGQLTPAAQQYLEAIKLNDKDGAPHSNIGLIYYMTENFPAAREHWRAAVALGSTYAPDRVGLLILDGRLSEARAQLEEYTQKNGEDEDGWLMLGDVYRALGDDSRARVTDARAAQIAPEYVGLRRPDLRRLAQGNAPPRNNTRPTSNSEGVNTDEKGRTALMRAAAQGRTDLIPEIIASGVDVNARDKEGYSALYFAAGNGHLETTQALLRAGAHVNMADNTGAPVLVSPSVQGFTAIVKLLLANGAGPNQADKDGDNALILASAAGKVDVVEALLAGGASVNVDNKNGITPVMIASFQGHVPTVRLLIARGADVNRRSVNGATAVSLATNKNHPDVVEILKRAGAKE